MDLTDTAGGIRDEADPFGLIRRGIRDLGDLDLLAGSHVDMLLTKALDVMRR